LNDIDQKKRTENFSLFGENPVKNNEKDDSRMAPEIRQLGEDLI
jgi:hypothetical protein